MVLCRDLNPAEVLHVAEHVVEADHVLISQSTPHGLVLHATTSESETSTLMTLRVLWRVPPPQVLLHTELPQAQATITQSPGHSTRWQPLVSGRARQFLPPNAVIAAMLRVRVLYPVPHDFVHFDQANVWALHLALSESRGQVLLP